MTLPLWKWQGLALVGGTSEQFKAFAKREIDADVSSAAHACGHAYLEYGKPWLLWVETLNVPNLAHEALHITAGLLEARGLKFTDASEEAYTYTLESIMQQVLTNKKWQTIKGLRKS